MQPIYSSPTNQAQRESSAYRLAETDRDFLLGNSMRGVRLQLEYQKVEERLRALGGAIDSRRIWRRPDTA